MKLPHLWFTRSAALVWLTLLGGCAGLFATDRSLFPAHSYQARGEDVIELSETVTPVPGLKLAPGTVVTFAQGHIRLIKPGADMQLDGHDIPSGSELLFFVEGTQLTLAHVTLSKRRHYGAMDFTEGDEVSFGRDGTPNGAKLGSNRVYNGKRYAEGTVLEIQRGRVTRARTQEQLQAELDAQEAEATRSYNDCLNQCAPLSDSTRGPCIDQCNQRLFHARLALQPQS